MLSLYNSHKLWYVHFQIDPDTVKQLDSNLFLGDEITEVYKEIMKTVPNDHLLLENVRKQSNQI